ncbi:Protein of unknown function DUF2257 [[Leptolyngbya] sp. PCC 7376]|uniref:2OG-Fe dioxygenase family protein n=1 Tax=[Leptolyngbya] sp. PCC 7376 TaxID=111781 RepID=UPI00029EF4F8|nr:2OG-Fe dioxygenase family protein [[Leptolyngbya] sp. PCC 7376]AFY36875.1 Protein of unknown function DUF2257 [[Leptolyngbya] sp. PCC 7376]
MLQTRQTQNFNCKTDYAIESLNAIDLAKFEPFFENLPVDPYLERGYRCRRFSRVQVLGDRLYPLAPNYFSQGQDGNSLLGGAVREYAELEPELFTLPDFQKLVLEFFDFARLCSGSSEVGIHQIRTVATSGQPAQPCPEGIHQDGGETMGIFCLSRQNVDGAKTSLYTSPESKPIITKILNPGEFLVISDRRYFHYTSPFFVDDAERGTGIRDVFVFTSPGLVITDFHKPMLST